MRGILRFGGRRVVESAEGLGDVTRHGDVDIAAVVVPVKLETKVLGAGPILGELILGGKRGE
jgi:predicted nucleotidyltransferase